MAKLKISDDLKNVIKQVVLDTYYPIGKTYITMGSEDPNKTIGGTWEKVYGGYLYAAQGSLGRTEFHGWGAQGTTLKIEQMPGHTHRIGFNASWGGPIWDCATQDGYVGPRDPGNALVYGASANQAFVQPKYGTLFNETIGGGQEHTHNIATINVWLWKRTA